MVTQPMRAGLPAEILWLASQGWKLLPVARETKAPLIKEWQNGAATDNIARLEAWFIQFPGCNWGVATGNASGFFVLDIDGQMGRDAVAAFAAQGLILPATLTVTTGRVDGGEHRLYRMPDGMNIGCPVGKLAPGLDIRGNGGQVVTVPSIHSSGKAYSFVDPTAPIADAPAWLLERIVAPKLADVLPMPSQPRQPATEHEVAYALKALREESAKFAALPAGTGVRNRALNNAALAIATMVAAGWLDSQTAWNALWEAAKGYRAQDGDTEASNTMRSGWEAGLLKPRAPLPVTETIVGPHNFTVSNPFQYAAAPQPLRRHVQRSSEFPINSLSDTLRHTVAAIEDTIQCPQALAAMSVLGVASLAVQAHANIVIPATGQEKPLSLFLMSIAESGERKTSSDDEALQPVKQYEKELTEFHTANLPTYRNQIDAWESERTHILRDKALTRDARLNKLWALGLKPEAPLTPMLTCSEPTIEGLYGLYQNGHPSLGLFSSEGAQFIGGHGMNDDARLRTAGALCCFWDGEPVKRVRAAQGETYSLLGRRLALHLMVQPNIAEQFLSLKDLQGQGIFSRILTAYPQSTIGNRLQHDKAKITTAVLDYYTKTLLQIFQLPIPLAAGTRNELVPRPLSFDTNAIARWTEYADSIEVSQRSGNRFDCIRGFAGKLVENASRIAGVMTLIENHNATSISLDMLDRVIEIADYFAKETLSMFETAKVSPDIRDAEKLLTWLQNDWHESHITVRVVSRKGPHSLSKTADARNAINVLVEHGWLLNVPAIGIIVDGYAVVKDVWLIRRENT